jgi:hypothetical protein
VLTPDDIAPVPRIGPDTRERWLVRDVPRAALEGYLNAVSALGWRLSECYTIQEAEPPLVPEILQVWCGAELPKPRTKRAKAPAPQVAE